MKVYNYSCQGESHKATDKECQDYSCTLSDVEKGLSIAVVCDGHGGDTYFRSAVGAKTAAEIAVSAIRVFVEDWDCSMIKNLPFTQMGTTDSQTDQNALDKVFRHLFSSIYSQWIVKITEDAQRPVTEWEQQHVKPEHLQLLQDADRIVKVYGCTLMAYAQTPDYWFAFHLGDGKCVMIDDELQFSQPIPWDERCFLNKTTSMCDSAPIGEFRYCVQADGHFPVAIFLGSDGLDDTFGDGERLYNFYGNILNEIYNNGLEYAKLSIKNALPQLSKVGSKDDMSVAFAYDESSLERISKVVDKQTITTIQADLEKLQRDTNDWQTKLDNVCRQLKELDNKRLELERKKHDLEREYERSKNDLEKAQQSLCKITKEKPECYAQTELNSSPKLEMDSTEQHATETSPLSPSPSVPAHETLQESVPQISDTDEIKEDGLSKNWIRRIFH